MKLAKRQPSEYDAHGLNAAAQYDIQTLAVALLQTHTKTPVHPHT
jgi:hypothetical protein